MRIGVALAAIVLSGIITVNAVAQKAEVTKQKTQVVSEKGKDTVACPMHKGVKADKAEKAAKHGAAKHMSKQGHDKCVCKGTAGSDCAKGCEGISEEGCEKECTKEAKAGKH
jgi:hypothetical protein